MKTILFMVLAFVVGCSGSPEVDWCDSDSGLGCTVTPTHEPIDLGDAGDASDCPDQVVLGKCIR